jgi:hypothetical protein
MYARGLQIEHVCVLVGIPLSQYGVVWVVCFSGVVMGLSRRVPSFASWLAIWLHVMIVCALTFSIVILYVNFEPCYLIDYDGYDYFVRVVVMG